MLLDRPACRLAASIHYSSGPFKYSRVVVSTIRPFRQPSNEAAFNLSWNNVVVCLVGVAPPENINVSTDSGDADENEIK
jgi:hypothetical protein